MRRARPRPIRSTAWQVLGACLLAVPLAAQSDPGPTDPPPPVPVPSVERGVEVTFLANAGFLLRSKAHSVLIDACTGERIGVYECVPGPVRSKLWNRTAPFDGAMLVLASHEHTDHVQLRTLEKLLLCNPGAHLVSSTQVVRILENGAADYAALKDRVESVPVKRGQTTTHTEEGLRVDFVQLDHAGKGHERLVNLGHLIELGGLRILHVGDAEPAPGNFAAYDLETRDIDVAIVPYWYFGSPGGAQVLRDEIRARTLIACHVPPREWDQLNEVLKTQFPEVLLFKDAMEARTFLPAGPTPGASTENAPGGR